MTKAEKQSSFLKDLFYTLLGSIPTLYICSMCGYMFYQDYALNRYSYSGQSRFYSMIEKFEIYENVTCSNDYAGDQDRYPQCVTKKCARYFTDLIVEDEETDQLLNIAKRVLGTAKKSNSYFDLNANKLSESFSQLESKLNQKSSNPLTVNEVRLKDKVVKKIVKDMKNRFIVNDLQPEYRAYFQKVSHKSSNNYKHSPQTDKELNSAIHYTATLYLNDHQIDYYGGRFMIDDMAGSTFLSIEPKKSRVIIYTTGSENKNQIEQVLSGDRYSFTIHFTCNS